MQRLYGDEYPAAVTLNGVRMPLVVERRWTRIYATEDRRTSHMASRFMDGSAAITYAKFSRRWRWWSKQSREEFCSACSWLHEQSDYPDILRHIMRHGTREHWRAVANSVGVHLPQDEAFGLLSQALLSAMPGDASNLTQGIARTKHPDAERVLRAHLAMLWTDMELWQNNDFINWVAFDATTCLAHLIELGASPTDFDGQVRQIMEHPCGRNRDSCRFYLGKSYPWLQATPEGSQDVGQP